MNKSPPNPAAQLPAADPAPSVHSELVTHTPLVVVVSVVVHSLLGNWTMLKSEKTPESILVLIGLFQMLFDMCRKYI